MESNSTWVPLTRLLYPVLFRSVGSDDPAPNAVFSSHRPDSSFPRKKRG